MNSLNEMSRKKGEVSILYFYQKQKAHSKLVQYGAQV